MPKQFVAWLCRGDGINLGDLLSVRTFVDAFLAKCQRLDALVNNAGVMKTPQHVTVGAFEIPFGIQPLGTVSADIADVGSVERLVTLMHRGSFKLLSRGGHRAGGKTDFNDLCFEHRNYDGGTASPNPDANDDAVAKRLWDVSADAVGG